MGLRRGELCSPARPKCMGLRRGGHWPPARPGGMKTYNNHMNYITITGPVKKQYCASNRLNAIYPEDGFTSAELIVVILVIALLTAFLLPAMLSLVSDTRLEGAKQDAVSIGAAIELLKVEDRFDPDDDGVHEMIFEKSGTRYPGQISDLQVDGGFIYTLTIGGAAFIVRYDAASGNVYAAGDAAAQSKAYEMGNKNDAGDLAR